jgi:hypothetical protein
MKCPACSGEMRERPPDYPPLWQSLWECLDDRCGHGVLQPLGSAETIEITIEIGALHPFEEGNDDN